MVPSIAEKVVPSSDKIYKNTDRRTREYLTPAEVTQLMQAARHVGRHGHRDTTLILLMYRHGLRVSEVTSLRWDAIDLKTALLHVRGIRLRRDSWNMTAVTQKCTAC